MRFWGKDRKQDNRKNIWIEHLNVDTGNWLQVFSGIPGSVFASVDDQKSVSITMQCIQQFYVDHKIFVEGFLLWNNTKYEWNNQTLLAYFQQDLKIEFEQVNNLWRICSMNTVLS